jgi:2Fe-2S thioredoxin-like protein
MAKRQHWDVDRAQTRIQELEHIPGALLPILHALQDEFGYVDKAAIPLIASALNVSHAEVHGVLSFYHDFRRASAGRHVLQMCRAGRRPSRTGTGSRKTVTLGHRPHGTGSQAIFESCTGGIACPEPSFPAS